MRVNQGYVYEDRMGPEAAGSSILAFYTERYPAPGVAGWAARIDAGRVRRNGATASAEASLRCGDRLTYHRPPWVEPRTPLDYAVAYEDDAVLVVDKPAGLPVTPDAVRLTQNLVHLVRRRFGTDVAPIHRLDRGTPGLVLFGKGAAVRRALSRELEAGRVHRRYLACVEGVDLPRRFAIDVPVGPVPHAPTGTVHARAPGGRPSRTRARVLGVDRARAVSWLGVVLDTGRPHQVRIHLAAIGHPLVGERLYGPGGVPRRDAGTVLPGDGGYALRAVRLGFRHPVRGRAMSVRASRAAARAVT